MSTGQAIRHVIVRGLVQGVGFRAWTEHVALARHLEGWVRNLRDGSVEAVFAGPPADVDAMVALCRRGPAGSRVSAVDEQRGSAELLAQRRTGERFSVLPTR
jgi:acylphosphatase